MIYNATLFTVAVLFTVQGFALHPALGAVSVAAVAYNVTKGA